MFRFPFFRKQPSVPPKALRQPLPSPIPSFAGGSFSAHYVGARKGGDFFDFASAGGRLVFLLLDIAGSREMALHIAAAVQDLFRERAATVFSQSQLNEAEAMSDLTHEMNHVILDAAGAAHFSPAFAGCFNPDLGTLCYINAGHTPALLRDSTGLTLLPANGLPLGLFLHATHDAQMSVLEPGAILMLVSRGLVEAPCRGAEYGMDRVQQFLASEPAGDPQAICKAMLEDVVRFTGSDDAANDMTTLALVRATGAQAAQASG